MSRSNRTAARKIAVLYSGNAHQYRTFTEPKYKKHIAELVYLPELKQDQMLQYDVLIVPSQLHQGLVTAQKAAIDQFLDAGKIVVSLGAEVNNWFPAHHWENRPVNFWWWMEKDGESGLELTQPEHPLFEFISLHDATWHYHGVFFPSSEVETLIQVKGDGAVFYIDKASTKGTLIMTTLDPEYHFGSYFMPATERFLDGFLPWLATGEI